MNLEFSRQNFEKYPSTNFVKISPVGAKLFHLAGGRTDMTKLTVAFCNSANALKNVITRCVIKNSVDSMSCRNGGIEVGVESAA
jgi:hypothetical protein